MTIRQWMVAVAVLASGLSVWVHRERLHRLSGEHTSRASQVRVEAARARPGTPSIPTPLSAWHLAMARKYHDQAELVESFGLTAILVAAVLGIGLPAVASLRQRGRGLISRRRGGEMPAIPRHPSGAPRGA